MEFIASRAPKCARLLAVLGAATWLAACASQPTPLRPAPKPPPPKLDPAPTWGGGMKALKYVPNRLFDVTDIVRMQVRLGPGWAIGARATSFVPLFVGGYNATWFGMPGPRNRAKIPLPLGLDSAGGFGLGGGEYGAAEFGVCAHMYMIGFDVGFDPRELFDFAVGFAGQDPSHDDF